ncbi:carboxypeptidase-like regulatory domain-containing protein [Microvirga sp. STR05]|uniref:Carboxypeptidase-like regulatory domain-containing protein n=1 Tax=Hymenobacter duratus TaxID=2771356 RepID=A0ABR8JD45_9BACT|nr:carboxypeptidase-like regulatory domain-containing protein [Hymenobacter duratus]MBD2713591.1 carboxypeptidase-like regulatory domain-containing protein [Hymenobacter duratus]MBR7948493.1 carboxypeptidase-like regulatory domain-containing protein [Microvirga sp. STR05]
MAFSVPNPCPKSWAAMTPTADGRHCGSCQHEVVDFSRMTEAEVTAWLARPAAGSVCGFFRAGQFAPVAAPAPAAQPRWRQWVLAAVALLGLKPLLAMEEAAALSPRRDVPRATEQADSHAEAPKGQVTVRGRVLDDSTGLGVQGAEIFIGDTPYGAVTDEQGNFSFTMKQLWAPVQNNLVSLRVQASPFVFVTQQVAVKVSPAPAPLVVRLKSIPGRGQIMGRIAQHEPPQKPPLQ